MRAQPLFHATDNDHSDIPVPDFTYACYPETRYVNSSWPAVRDLLTRKSAMLRWEDRRNDIFHRWRSGGARALQGHAAPRHTAPMWRSVQAGRPALPPCWQHRRRW